MLITPPTVLVTGAGGPAGRSAVAQLIDRGVPVIATDIAETPTPAGTFLLGPRADSPSYLPFLHRTIRQHGVDLLIPTVQDELPAVSAAAPVLDCVVAIGSPAPVSICHDKLLTMQFLESRGLPVPATGDTAVQCGGFPLVVKPRISRGSRGITVVDDVRGMPAADDRMIVQELAPGQEYNPQVHRSAHDGSITVVVLRKTMLRDGVIGHREQVARLAPDAEPDIVQLASDVADRLDLHGPMDMDVRRSRSGEPLVLEVNARLGANCHHAPELLDGVLSDARAHGLAPATGATALRGVV